MFNPVIQRLLVSTAVSSIAAAAILKITFKIQDARLQREIDEMHKKTDEYISSTWQSLAELVNPEYKPWNQ